MRVHEAVATAVADLTDTLFGLLGDSNLFLANAYVERHGGRYVSAVHEAGAVMMAHGYACRGDRLGVATVTQGPGLTNTATALVEVTRARTPLLVLCGDTAPGNTGNIQTLAQREFVAGTGAEYVLVGHPAEAAGAVHRAASIAVGQRRPVVVNCPTEYQWVEVPETTAPTSVRQVIPEPDEVQVDAALGVIASARRPLVLAGDGVRAPHRRQAVLDLATRVGAPIATTLRGRGLYSAADGCVGIFGTLSTEIGVDAIGECDCVIAFGAGLNTWTTGGNALLDGKSVVHCDVDPDAIGRHAPVTAGVVGDAAAVAAMFVKHLDEAEVTPSSYLTRLRPRLTDEALRWQATPSDPLRLDGALSALDRALPLRRTVVHDGGRFLGESFRYVCAPEPAAQVLTTAFGAVGLGIGAAIGAACAAPNEPTVFVTGDGGFMMSGLNELHSAVRAAIPLVVVVCNDGSYGAEYDQFVQRGVRPELALFGWPSFSEAARAIGCDAYEVRDTSSLRAALRDLSDRTRPLLIDIRVPADSVPEVAH
jgi:thiamine pyrophosphate-dependent acetolactate synthase large subunit-like protein